MSHFDDAKALVNHATSALPKLEQDYQSSLNNKSVKVSLRIDIKGIMEHLRSALDYSAHALFTKYGSSATANPKIYFPYATLGDTPATFRASSCSIERRIPGITATRADIVARLESYQHYSDPANRWLPLFMDLNNENKHEKLTPQTRQEALQRRIESRGAAMELSHEAAVDLEPGASIKLGDLNIPGGQRFSGERPATYDGSGTQTVVRWVSFTFNSNGEEVLSFLKKSLAGVRRIVDELAAL